MKSFHHITLSIKQVIVDYLLRGKIDLEPPYQREVAWNTYKQSELIQTLLDEYPIPALQFHKDLGGKFLYECMDGKNRLVALRKFITGDIKSSEGIAFKEMNEDARADFEGIQISICVFEHLTPREREDYFRRIQNGVRLNQTEIMWSECDHNLVIQMKLMKPKVEESIEDLWSTKRYADMMLYINIVAMILGKGPTLHSTHMMDWLDKQPKNSDYSAVMDAAKTIILNIATIDKLSTSNDKCKKFLILDVCHWMTHNGLKVPDVEKIDKFISDLDNLHAKGKEAPPASRLAIRYYEHIRDSVGSAGFSMKMAKARLQILTELLA